MIQPTIPGVDESPRVKTANWFFRGNKAETVGDEATIEPAGECYVCT